MKKFFLFFMIFVFVAFLCFFFFFLFTGKPIKSIFNIASGIKPTEKTIQTDENERDTFLDKTLVLESVSLYYENTVTDINNFTNPDTYDVNNFQTDKSYQTDNLIETPDYLVDDYQLLTNENNYELTFVKDNNIDISLVLPLPCVSSVVIFADSYLVPLINGTILCFDLNKTLIKKIPVPFISKISVELNKILIYGKDGFLYTYNLLKEGEDLIDEPIITDGVSDKDLVYETILPSKEVFDKIIYSVSNFIDISQVSYDKITEYGFAPVVNSQSMFTNDKSLSFYIAGIPESGEWTFTFFDEHGFKYDQWGLIGLYDLDGNQLACNVEYSAENAGVNYPCSKGDIFYLVVSLMGEEYPEDKLYIGTVKE